MKKAKKKSDTKAKKAPKTALEKAIQKLTPDTKKWPYTSTIRYVFSGVEYDYDRSTNCINSGCDSICRCQEITNARITKVDISHIASSFISEVLGVKIKSEDKLDVYCIDRIIRLSGLRKTENWELDVHKGYYGDECSGPYPDEQETAKIRDIFQSMLELSAADKIKACLKEEYGHILPKLLDCTKAEIITTDPKDVEMFNESYMRKLDKEYVEQYNEYKLPRAVVDNGGKFKYRLIDGYNRMTSANNQSLISVDVVLLS